MKKEVTPIVITGHVDHGKSTLIGRLLLETNSLPKEKIAEIKKISAELGRDAELAFLTDQLEEEREKSLTIDTTQMFFGTRRRDYCIIDTPGHVEFLKNMISGATLAEAAVLLIDVSEGLMEQTMRHLNIINMLGLNQLIIVLNKMDLAGYKKDVFDRIKNELSSFLGNAGMSPSVIMPISARNGDNISKKSHDLRWYKGPTLLKALDLLKTGIEDVNKPLRFPIQDVYDVAGKQVAVGRVASGVIKRGQRACILPAMKDVRINTINVFERRNKSEAESGESIGVTLKNAPEVKRGDVIAQKENMPVSTVHYEGEFFWLSDRPLHIGNPVILRCATQETRGIVEKIGKRINSSTLEVIEEDAREIKLNEAASAVFKTEKPLIAEKFSFIPELGRFTIERDGIVAGMGIILNPHV